MTTQAHTPRRDRRTLETLIRLSKEALHGPLDHHEREATEDALDCYERDLALLMGR